MDEAEDFWDYRKKLFQYKTKRQTDKRLKKFIPYYYSLYDYGTIRQRKIQKRVLRLV